MALQPIETKRDGSIRSGINKDSFLKGFARTVIKPFARAGKTAESALVGATGAAVAGTQALLGKEEQARRTLDATRQKIEAPVRVLGEEFGGFGFNPEGDALSTGRFAMDIMGGGVELATTVLGGGVVGAGVKTGVTAARAGVKTLAKQAFTAGRKLAPLAALEAVGAEAQEEDADVTSLLASGAVGAGVGFGLGMMAPAVTGAVSKFATGASRTAARQARRATSAAGEVLERGESLSAMSSPARDAVKTGIDLPLVKAISSTSKADRAAFSEMLDLAQKKVADPLSQDIPRVVIGRNLLRRGTFLLEESKKFGRQLGEIKRSLTDEVVDEAGKMRGLAQDILSRRGLGIEGGRIVTTPETRVPSTDLSFYQKMVDDLMGNGAITARTLDASRERLFKEFKQAAAQLKPFSDVVDADVRAIRKASLEVIDEVAPGYADLSQKFAVTREPVEKLAKLLGLKQPIETIGTKELRGGEVARRLLGNASDKVKEVVDMSEAAARSLGKEFEDSLHHQAFFEAVLERLFGTTQLNSLKGQVAGAGEEVAGAGFDAATGNLLGLVLRGLRSLQGKSKADQIKALQRLLKDLD